MMFFAAVIAALATWAIDSYLERPGPTKRRFPNGYGGQLFEEWEE